MTDEEYEAQEDAAIQILMDHGLMPREGVRGWQSADYTCLIADLRAALTPPVKPLRSGETVTIPDAEDDLYRLEVWSTDDSLLSVAFMIGLEQDDTRVLDAAGVDTLIETAQRWRAAQREAW